MKKILFLFTVLFTLHTSAQNLENANWCFKLYNKIAFSSSTPSASSCASGGAAVYGGSGASVSDNNGQLLFYTDGITLWDKTDMVMSNGINISAGVDAHWNQQTTVIVPKPGYDKLYYIFTSSFHEAGPVNGIGHGGLHYSVVDMNLNNGKGDVIWNQKNIPLNNENGIPIDYDYSNNTGLKTWGSGITTTLNSAKDKIWLTFYTRFNENNVIKRYYYRYLISINGINNTTDGVSPDPTKYTLLDNANYPNGTAIIDFAGLIKTSPNGSYLSDAIGLNVNLYDFNNQTGDIQFNRTVYSGIPFLTNPGFGLEFSPNSQYLYFSTYDNQINQDGKISGGVSASKTYVKIWQCSMLTRSIDTIVRFEIPSTVGLIPIPAWQPYGDLQLAIDNKIYVCSEALGGPVGNWIGVIQSPDLVAPACNFTAYGVQLLPGKAHEGSLPQWIHKAIVHIWPKVYEAVEPVGAVKLDNNGNVLCGLYLNNMANNMNHNGPVDNTSNLGYTIQYNKTDGSTNWKGQNWWYNVFTTSFGSIQYFQNTSIYRNTSNGTVIPGPSYVPNNENIVAEDNGVFVTSHIDHTTSNMVDELWVHASPAIHNSIAIPNSPGYYVGINRVIFNPITKHLFMNYTNNKIVGNIKNNYLAIYTLINNTLSNPVYYLIDYPLAGVNSVEEVFVFDNNGVIQKCNYQTNTYTPLSVTNNGSLTYLQTLKQTVEDEIIAANFSEGKIYCFNTNPSTLTTKKISATLNSTNYDPLLGYYFVDGNDVYLTGGFSSPSFTIGNQTMPLLGNMSSFITKFDIQNDFTFRSALEGIVTTQPGNQTITTSMQQNRDESITTISTINVTLSPNPAKNSLLINLNQKGNEDIGSFMISITNTLGVTIFKQSTQQKILTVDISQFSKGMYYMTITTEKGEKTTQMFMKE